MNNFLSELSRRNVFRVAAAYVIVGWILLQVASIAAPAMHLPDWAVSLVLYILIIGFPLAILLTWAFEMTPEGMRKSKVDDTATTQKPASMDLALVGVASILIALALFTRSGPDAPDAPVAAATQEPSPEQGGENEGQVSIAVLAFVNMSGDPENEYFSDGISEENLKALAGIKSMRVAARTSAFSFKGRNEDIREIGNTLDVAHVLEGSVRRHDNRVRVTAQLIDVTNGYHLWSSTYDRELTDIFGIQEEIAKAITAALKVELDIQDRDNLGNHGTDSIEAYMAYLKGREPSPLENSEVFADTIEHFRRAVAIDPNFADAWGALAMALAVTHMFQPFGKISEDLHGAFKKALELNPNQPDALAAKASYINVTEKDWRTSGELYRRALKFDTRGTTTRLYAGQYLTPLGRYKQADILYAESLRLDPLNVILAIDRAFFGHRHLEPDYGYQLWQQSVERTGGVTIDLCGSASALARMGDLKAANEILAHAPPSLDPWAMYQCAQAYFELDRRAEFDSSLAQLKALSETDYQYIQAHRTLLALVDEKEEWIELLLKAIAQNEMGAFFIRSRAWNPASLADDNRYPSFLKQMRLDDASLAEMGMVWGEAE